MNPHENRVPMIRASETIMGYTIRDSFAAKWLMEAHWTSDDDRERTIPMLDGTRIAEMRGRLERASKGPYHTARFWPEQIFDAEHKGVATATQRGNEADPEWGQRVGNADLLAHSWQDITDLLAEHEAMLPFIERLVQFDSSTATLDDFLNLQRGAYSTFLLSMRTTTIEDEWRADANIIGLLHVLPVEQRVVVVEDATEANGRKIAAIEALVDGELAELRAWKKKAEPIVAQVAALELREIAEIWTFETRQHLHVQRDAAIAMMKEAKLDGHE